LCHCYFYYNHKHLVYFVSYVLLSGVCRDFVFSIVNKIRGGRPRNCHSIAGRSNVFFSTAKHTHMYRISASFICSVHCWLFPQIYNDLVVKLPNHLSPNTDLKNECSYRPTYILSNDFVACTATT